jgi:hypothetical protein
MGTTCDTHGSEQKFCLESLEERRLLGKIRHRPKDNINMCLKGRGRIE